MNKITGNTVMFISDLHFSDVFTGKHKDYLSNCFLTLKKLTDKIKEKKPDLIFLLGDIIGWTETNIRNREIFSMFCKVLRDWNTVGVVYAVRGNHDMKGYPDFQFLVDLGFIRTCKYVDFYTNKDTPEIRFHIVNYGEESEVLNLLPDTSNIVLAHNNFTINGVTTWYNSHDGIELNLQRHWAGVDLVISGHIHNPSPEIYSTRMVDGSDCMLFYPGCPTRPIKEQNIYEKCWHTFCIFNPETDSTDFITEDFELEPSKGVFHEEEYLTDKTEEEIDEAIRKEELSNILNDLLTYRMNTGDPVEQVKRIPNATEKAKEIAIEYLQTAFNT